MSLLTTAARLALALLFLAPGCSPMDLGEAPFLCNNGTPKCPEGYICSGGACVREGSSYTPSDGGGSKKDGPGGKKDGPGSKKDGPVINKDGPVINKDGPVINKDGPVINKDSAPPGPVKILITEFMANPDAVSDSNGEWMELFNPGNVQVNINGWTIKDKGVDKHKLSNSGPLYVPAYGFLVLGRSMNKSLNGGVPVAYAYASFFLANTSDEVILLNEKDTVIDSFTYSSSFSIPTGASLSVKTPGANKNLSSSWCTETSGWGGSLGDKGTPLTKTGCK